jgi:hypothetical protein
MRHSNRFLRLIATMVVSASMLPGCSQTGAAGSSPRLPTDAELEQYNAQVPPERRIVCRMETPIESNIARRVCREVRDIKEATDFQREQLRRVIR